MIRFAKIIIFFLVAAFVFSCDKQLSVSPPVGPVPVGFIYIDSNPPGALIYEDGRNSGKYTPDSLAWLEERTYRFTLKKQFYRDTSFSITISDADTQFVFIDYLKNSKMFGKILCNTNASEANIYINDSLVEEKTPTTFVNLIPGYYKIKYSKNGFRTDSTIVTVESNKIADASKVLVDTTVWVDYKTNTSPLPDNAITALVIDENNVKWIGTQSGLIKYDGVNWEFYNEQNSQLPSDNITTLSVNNNQVWVGTYKGAVMIDNGNWTLYDQSNAPMANPLITSFTFQSDGTFWIGTIQGLIKHGQSGWFFYDSTKSGIPHRWVTDVKADNFGNIWVGTKFGLAQLDAEGNWTRYVKELVDDFIQAPFPSNFVSNIAVYNNEIWVSFDPDPNTQIGGLVRKIGARWESNFNPLPSNIIKAIRVEKLSGRKWIATKEGLLTFINFFDRKVFKKENSGFVTNYVTDVAFDKKNNYVWVATSGGGFYKFKRNF